MRRETTELTIASRMNVPSADRNVCAVGKFVRIMKQPDVAGWKTGRNNDERNKSRNTAGVREAIEVAREGDRDDVINVFEDVSMALGILSQRLSKLEGEPL